MKSPENRRNFGKTVLNSFAGVILTAGGISVGIGGTYDLFVNQFPAQDRYNENLEKLKKHDLTTELPPEPDITRGTVDVLGLTFGPSIAYLGFLILKENLSQSSKK